MHACGIPKLIEDGVTGLLFDSGDQAGLEAALLRCLDDPALCARMAAAGRQCVEERFGVRRMASEYHQHYLELLERKGAFAARARQP